MSFSHHHHETMRAQHNRPQSAPGRLNPFLFLFGQKIDIEDKNATVVSLYVSKSSKGSGTSYDIIRLEFIPNPERTRYTSGVDDFDSVRVYSFGMNREWKVESGADDDGTPTDDESDREDTLWTCAFDCLTNRAVGSTGTAEPQSAQLKPGSFHTPAKSVILHPRGTADIECGIWSISIKNDHNSPGHTCIYINPSRSFNKEKEDFFVVCWLPPKKMRLTLNPYESALSAAFASQLQRLQQKMGPEVSRGQSGERTVTVMQRAIDLELELDSPYLTVNLYPYAPFQIKYGFDGLKFRNLPTFNRSGFIPINNFKISATDRFKGNRVSYLWSPLVNNEFRLADRFNSSIQSLGETLLEPKERHQFYVPRHSVYRVPIDDVNRSTLHFWNERTAMMQILDEALSQSSASTVAGRDRVIDSSLFTDDRKSVSFWVERGRIDLTHMDDPRLRLESCLPPSEMPHSVISVLDMHTHWLQRDIFAAIAALKE